MEEGEGREAMAHKLLALPRPRKLTLKGYRQHWVIFKDTTLSYYKSQDEAPGDPIQQLNLKGKGIPVATALNLFPPRSWVSTIYPEEAVGGETGFQTGYLLFLAGCEVVPDVNVSGQKFCIKLLVPSPEGMSEIYLRCQDVSRLDQGGNRNGGEG